MNSPWGLVDDQRVLGPGVLWVNTPSHGGLRVDTRCVSLSASALRRGIGYGPIRWYEEDCEYAIACWELPAIWPLLFDGRDVGTVKQQLHETLSAWDADYLLEIEGIAVLG